MNKRSFLLLTPLATTIYNLMLAYVVYFLARVLYLVLNYSYFAVDMTYGHLLELFLGGLVFDTSAILVTNIPYIVLMLLPWHGKETRLYQQICKWVYLCINGLALFVNLCDAVYFRFTMRRTTTTIFSEFSNEGNLGSIFLKEVVNHFYLVFVFGVIVWALYKCYRSTRLRQRHYVWWQYDVAMLLSLLFGPPSQWQASEAASPRPCAPSPSRMPTSMPTIPSRQPWCSIRPSPSIAPSARMSSWCPTTSAPRIWK